MGGLAIKPRTGAAARVSERSCIPPHSRLPSPSGNWPKADEAAFLPHRSPEGVIRGNSPRMMQHIEALRPPGPCRNSFRPTPAGRGASHPGQRPKQVEFNGHLPATKQKLLSTPKRPRCCSAGRRAAEKKPGQLLRRVFIASATARPSSLSSPHLP